MTEPTHQPGPWYVLDRHHKPWTDALVICYGPNREFAGADSGDIAYTTRGFEDGPSWANANLIAAAPVMFDALRFIAELAEEELPHARVGSGAEIVLRHTLRRARAALQALKDAAT